MISRNFYFASASAFLQHLSDVCSDLFSTFFHPVKACEPINLQPKCFPFRYIQPINKIIVMQQIALRSHIVPRMLQNVKTLSLNHLPHDRTETA